MFAQLRRVASDGSDTRLQIAGGYGDASQTSNYRIESLTTFQQVAYIGDTQGDQFARPGSMTSITFSSQITFATLDDAEFYLSTLDADLIDQRGLAAIIATRKGPYSQQVETVAATEAAGSSGNIIVTITAREYASNIVVTVPVLNLDTPTIIQGKIISAVNANASFRKIMVAEASASNSIKYTKKQSETDDATLQIVYTTSVTGITGKTSTNTTAGNVGTLTNQVSLSSVSASVLLAHRGCTVSLEVALVGRRD
jgi:hypothetical protein